MASEYVVVGLITSPMYNILLAISVHGPLLHKEFRPLWANYQGGNISHEAWVIADRRGWIIQNEDQKYVLTEKGWSALRALKALVALI